MDAQGISLKELIRMSIGDPVRWIQGDPEIRKPYHWIASSPGEASEGDILLMHGEELDDETLEQIHNKECLP